MKLRKGFPVVVAILTAGFVGAFGADTSRVPSDETVAKVEKATQRSLDAFDKVLAKVPEAFHPAIADAMAAVSRGHDEALLHLTQIPFVPTLPETPAEPAIPQLPDGEIPSSQGRESNPEGLDANSEDGLARAMQAIDEGAAQAVGILEGIRSRADFPQQAFKGLDKAINAIMAGRDRALATLENAIRNELPDMPELPDVARVEIVRPEIPERPPLPERLATPDIPERPETPDRS